MYGLGYFNSDHGIHSARELRSQERTKSVFTTDMVFHVWAQLTQSQGRNAKGSAYFEHRTLYSYGAHYVLGYILPCRGDYSATSRGMVLINDDSASVTTNRHRGAAHAAVSGPVVSVPGLTSLVSILRRANEATDAAGAWLCVDVALSRVIRNTEGFPVGAAESILDAMGAPNPGRLAARLIREGDRARAKEKAAKEKKARALTLHHAKITAEMNPAEWLESMRQRANSEYALSNGLDRDLSSKATEFRRYRLAAKDAGWTRIAARLGELEHATRNFVKNELLSRAYRAKRHADKRGAINDIRLGLDELRNVETMLSPALKRAAHAARHIAVPESRKPKFRALSDLFYSAHDLAAAQERKRAAAVEAARRAEWIAGGRVAYRNPEATALVRAVNVTRDESGNITGGTLETSKGAAVPLLHAIKAFRFIKLVRARGTEWRRNGKTVRVGHFQIDSVSPNGNFRAGCHQFAWGDVAALAERLGLSDLTAEDTAEESRH